jgi:hypothetical protein
MFLIIQISSPCSFKTRHALFLIKKQEYFHFYLIHKFITVGLYGIIPDESNMYSDTLHI